MVLVSRFDRFVVGLGILVVVFLCACFEVLFVLFLILLW